jgi:uncharacterized protein YlaI
MKKVNIDNMSDKQLRNYWIKKMKKLLLNQTIVKVDYVDDKGAEEMGLHNKPIQIKLSNGLWLTPMKDDEGNDGGAIHTNHKEEGVIPTL